MRNAKLADSKYWILNKSMDETFTVLCLVEAFRKAKGLKSLGIPHFVSHGSHELNDIKHRFLVMPRYGKDIWKIYKENDCQLPEHTIYRLSLQMVETIFVFRYPILILP